MKLINKNRKATFNYEIIEKYIAGMVLVGSEVKSIRNSNVSIAEAYCYINDGEFFIKGMHVAEHKEGGTHNNHEPLRDRKLLMNKKEILKLEEKKGQKGLTIIPLAILLTDKGLIKLEVGLGKGKNINDKRNSLKEKDLDREISKG